MEANYSYFTRRRPPPPTPPSPRLTRSKSGTEHAITTSTANSQRYTSTTRSKSTTRSRITTKHNKLQNINTSTPTTSPMTTHRQNQHGSLTRGSPRNNNNNTSPSAWALSPGRSRLPAEPSPGTYKKRGGGGGIGGGVGSVLRYFKQKKVPPMQEEEYHRFRVLHNRLLQWRFVNAKANSTMASLKLVAEGELFHAWLKILRTRNQILEDKIQIQKLKHKIKLYGIVDPQLNKLNEWSKLEGRNCEAVSRTIRKLRAISVRFPVEDNVKGDVASISEAMSMATSVMDDIEIAINKFLSQAEKVLYLITELASTLEHQEESFEKMEKIIIDVAKLLAWDESVGVQLLQQMKDYNKEQGQSKLKRMDIGNKLEVLRRKE